MQIARHINSLQQELAAITIQGESVALVPTMGNLHGGHISLIRQARKLADRVSSIEQKTLLPTPGRSMKM